MSIPREVIEDICARSDIEEIIGSYVTLKRAGSNYSALCPFHSEKTPSFTVFTASNSFYCFGCGAGGDVITFIMRAENLDYIGAVGFLAARAGITLPEEKKFNDNEENKLSKKRVIEMNLDAARFFRERLFDPVTGSDAMEYLSTSRKLDSAIIKHFGIGFSPNVGWMLTEHLKKKGYTDDELIGGFLCGKSQKSGRLYDYFRNRIIFPIIDTAGNVIAFGGRVMDDSKPKYLNSSDTPAFNKRRNLFALNYAKNYCRDSMILCEGYMDVIALHAAGFQNAIATLGTAITPEQARIMSKYTKKVIVSYDSDEAGQRAADKAMKLLGEVGLEVRVLSMKGAKDPDEYIKKFGAQKFSLILDGSRTGFDYKMQNILDKYDITIPNDKIAASFELCALISTVHSAVEREVYIARVAKALEVTTEALKGDVARQQARAKSEYMKKQGSDARLLARNIGDRVNPDAAKNVLASGAETVILGLMLIYDEYREAVVKGKVALCAEDFFTSFGKRVFTAITDMQSSDGGFNYSLMAENFTPDEMGKIQEMQCKRAALSENGESVFLASVEALKNETASVRAKETESVSDAIEKKRQMLKNKGKK